MTKETEVSEALYAVADALNNVAESLKKLGLNNATTEYGALELLAKEIRDGFATATSRGL